MEVVREIEVGASSNDLWSILDGEFAGITRWAARMLESERDDSLGELGGRQVTTVEYGPAAETLYRRDAETHSLGYWVTGPTLPPPIKDVQTEWRIFDADHNQSRVQIRFLAVVQDPAAQPMLERVLEQGMAPLLDELKHYAETGEPHPNNSSTNTGESS